VTGPGINSTDERNHDGDGPEGGALLEREESLSALTQLLVDVRASGTGRLVLLGGEAGVGKTTLLQHFCTAQDRRVRVLWGGCEPLRTPRPLGPLWDIADSGGVDLPELDGGAPRPGEMVVALLRELRRRTPTLLVLEDLHWADEATLDVLSLLASRIVSAPALVLASYRDDELDRATQLRLLLGELVRRPGRLTVAPLSRGSVQRLAGPQGLDADELFRTTGGNPFFLTEILATPGEQIPDTVRDAVLARASRLSEPARTLLEAVAVIPGPVEVALLEVLAPDRLDRLQECLGSGMLNAAGTQVVFRHELARLAVEEAVVPHRRLELHRAALAALESRSSGTDAARLAHHAEAAGDAGAVARWAPVAAIRAASSGAHREAAEQYARALRFAEDLPAATRGDLFRRCAYECYMTDQFLEALEAQEQALACFREAGDGLAEGDCLRAISRLLFFLGRTEEGEPVARQAVELLEGMPPSHELAMAYGNMSQRRMVVEEAGQARAWAHRTLELAATLDDSEALVYGLTNIGAGRLQAGEDEGRLELERALALALRHGLEEYAGRVFLQLVHCLVRLRRFDLARRHLEEGLKYCADHGLDTWRLYLLSRQARIQLDQGEWDAAADSVGIVLRDPRSAPVPRGWALVILGLIRVRRGDPEAAAPLSEAHELVRHAGEISRLGPVAAARAEQAWLRGDADGVRQTTEDALALARRRDADWIAAELEHWRWRAGLEGDADGRAVGAATGANPFRLSMVGHWAQAAARWEEIGCPYEAALAMADAGDPATLREAIERLQGMGARPAAAVVARRLRERGVRGIPRGPRPRTRQNPAGLTPRELEVLTHLTQGLRNAQIAQRLVVSEKTVDHHVSAVLRKLGVSNRGEASAKAARLGLTPPSP
jgi:DNA-binding CsgD family transcriptional regulator/tetratricopeptide (TPR) repeat protein